MIRLTAQPMTTVADLQQRLQQAIELEFSTLPVTAYDDAHRAILRIVSQGEGNPTSPLDFAGEVSHYYRFSEIRRNQVLEKADNPQGFVWGAPLGVHWESVVPAISNPSEYDYSCLNLVRNKGNLTF